MSVGARISFVGTKLLAKKPGFGEGIRKSCSFWYCIESQLIIFLYGTGLPIFCTFLLPIVSLTPK